MPKDITPHSQPSQTGIDAETDTPTAILSEEIISLVESYKAQALEYKNFEEQLQAYFLELFSNQNVELQLESRTKSAESVQEKIFSIASSAAPIIEAFSFRVAHLTATSSLV